MGSTTPLRTLAAVVGICAWVLLTPAVRAGVTITNVFVFSGTNGIDPQPGLVLYTNGSFIGTTHEGGIGGTGTVFALTLDGTLTTLLTFYGTNGSHPCAGLTLASDGSFYGMTADGGVSNSGTVFKMSPTGAGTVLVSFTGTNGGAPAAGIIEGKDGNFYGTTELGGANGRGTIFKMTSEGSLTTLYSFNRQDGCSPEGPLVQAQDGNFYGTTTLGGLYDGGTVFRMTPDGGVTFLTAFGYSNGYPGGRLIQGTDGNLYGTTSGLNIGYGTAFRITTNGMLTTLVAFDENVTNGQYPSTGMTEASDRNYYGTCALGGAYDRGTIFRITPDGSFSVVYSFTGGSDGMWPITELLQGPDGNLYGTTFGAGPSFAGSVFRLSVPMPPVLQPPQIGGGIACLSWSSVAGQSYQLESCSGLGANTWSDLGLPVAATNGVMHDCHATGTDLQRFYRVRLLP